MKLLALIALDVLLLSIAGWYAVEGIAASDTPGATETRHIIAQWAFLALFVTLVVLIVVGLYRTNRKSPPSAR